MKPDPCRACGKPVSPKALKCPWCGVVHREPGARQAAAEEELEAEARELDEWKGSEAPPLPILNARVTIGLALLGGFGLAVAPLLLSLNELGLGWKILIVVEAAVLGLGALLVRARLRYGTARLLQTPQDAVLLCFGRAADGDFHEASAALAGHPSALKRHENLAQQWKRSNPSDAFTEASIGDVQVGPPEILAPAVALVPIRVVLSRTQGLTIPMVGSYHRTENAPKDLVKLAVERGGRWFVVNAFLADRLDRRLAEHLARRQSGG